MTLRQITKQLTDAGMEDALWEALLLAEHFTGRSRSLWRADMDTDIDLPALAEAVEKRCSRYPLQYILGSWEFMGLSFTVREGCLIPRPDTEVLAEQAIEFVQTQGACRVLDLCAGSGCIGLAIAANAPECRVLLGEISEAAVRICRQNIRRNGLTGQVTVMNMDALQQPPRAIGEFQCIVSNPPYIPRADIDALDTSVKDFEPYLALCGGEDGYDFYTAIIRYWKEALVIGGRMYFEVGIGQADTVLRMMRAEGFGDLQIIPDLNGIPRVVFGTRLSSIE